MHLLLAYHSAQRSHTWSDLITSETTILVYFVLVFLSSTLMKKLTRNVGIISPLRIFGLDI